MLGRLTIAAEMPRPTGGVDPAFKPPDRAFLATVASSSWNMFLKIQHDSCSRPERPRLHAFMHNIAAKR